jgi:hypothetical protein
VNLVYRRLLLTAVTFVFPAAATCTTCILGALFELQNPVIALCIQQDRHCKFRRNILARSHNHFYCVCTHSYTEGQCAYAVLYCLVWPVWLFHIAHELHDFEGEKNLLDMKCVCLFLCSVQLFLKVYKKKSTRYCDKCSQVVM